MTRAGQPTQWHRHVLPGSVKALLAGGATAMMLLALNSLGEAAEVPSVIKQGHTLVTRLCAGCHAIEKAGTSPRLAAPEFRHLGRKGDVGDLVARLQHGQLVDHEDMPDFRFSSEEAQAIVAYLRSIQGP